MKSGRSMKTRWHIDGHSGLTPQIWNTIWTSNKHHLLKWWCLWLDKPPSLHGICFNEELRVTHTVTWCAHKNHLIVWKTFGMWPSDVKGWSIVWNTDGENCECQFNCKKLIEPPNRCEPPLVSVSVCTVHCTVWKMMICHNAWLLCWERLLLQSTRKENVWLHCVLGICFVRKCHGINATFEFVKFPIPQFLTDQPKVTNSSSDEMLKNVDSETSSKQMCTQTKEMLPAWHVHCLQVQKLSLAQTSNSLDASLCSFPHLRCWQLPSSNPPELGWGPQQQIFAFAERNNRFPSNHFLHWCRLLTLIVLLRVFVH